MISLSQQRLGVFQHQHFGSGRVITLLCLPKFGEAPRGKKVKVVYRHKVESMSLGQRAHCMTEKRCFSSSGLASQNRNARLCKISQKFAGPGREIFAVMQGEML